MTTTATEVRSWVPELTFGARLALVRHTKGWNMKEAAKACDLPAQSWRQWEVGGHLPRRYVQVAKQIAGATGVDYLWLVHGPDRGQGGGEGLNARYRPLTERVVATIGSPTNRTAGRPKVRRPNRKPSETSSVRPTRRRAEPIASPNRAELVAV